MRDRDNDDFDDDIPPLVPPRDEVVSRQKKQRQQEVVRPGQYAEKVRVSTWPVRIMLAALTLALAGGAAYGYNLHQESLSDLDQANRRIADLENRLAVVGDSAEETTENVIERLDFNFSEIDKLWAARNATNRNVQDLTGRVANNETAVEETTQLLEDTNQRLVQVSNLAEDTQSDLGSLESELGDTRDRIASLNSSVDSLQSRTRELMNLRESLAGGEISGGLEDRLTRVEEAVEAIDAYRLQMNQTVMRLQDRIDSL